MRQFHIFGMVYESKDVAHLREQLESLRQRLVAEGRNQWNMTLTHTLRLLAHVEKEMKEEEKHGS